MFECFDPDDDSVFYLRSDCKRKPTRIFWFYCCLIWFYLFICIFLQLSSAARFLVLIVFSGAICILFLNLHIKEAVMSNITETPVLKKHKKHKKDKIRSDKSDGKQIQFFSVFALVLLNILFSIIKL